MCPHLGQGVDHVFTAVPLAIGILQVVERADLARLGDQIAAEADPAGGETTSADGHADTAVDETAEVPRRRGVRQTLRTQAAALLLAAALVASAGLTAWLYLERYRPDQQTDAAAEQVALDAATSGTVALLSYSPESLDQDFAAAKARLARRR